MTAVFVHGVPETTRVWEPLVAHLERDDVALLALPGFGSPLPVGFDATMETYASWLAAELARFDEVDEAVGEQLGVHAEVLVVTQGGQDGVGDRSDPRLDRRSVRDALRDECSDGRVGLVGFRRFGLHQRAVDPTPPGDLRDVHRVVTEGARHVLVRLQEHRPGAEESADVVGIGAQAEVAVAVRQRCSRDDQRATNGVTQQVRHLAEVSGHQIYATRMEVRPGHAGQEVRDVVQTVAVAAVQVATVDQRVHLVHADTLDQGRSGGLLDRVEGGDGLTHSERDDEVRPVRDQIQDGVGRSSVGAERGCHVRPCRSVLSRTISPL